MSGDIHALSGAYAVDALDVLERERFEKHLEECSACRDEVASLREAAATMPATTARSPRPGLRQSVLAEIATVRPLPPALPPADDLEERRHARRRRFPVLVAAAAALIAIGGVGATVWHPWAEDPAPVTAGQRIQDAQDAETFTQQTQGGATVTVVRSESLNQAMLSTEDMDQLGEGLVYQLWLMHDGEPVKAGLMEGDTSSMLLQGDPASAQAAAITIEPEGGSMTPSTQPIMIPFKQT